MKLSTFEQISKNKIYAYTDFMASKGKFTILHGQLGIAEAFNEEIAKQIVDALNKHTSKEMR